MLSVDVAQGTRQGLPWLGRGRNRTMTMQAERRTRMYVLDGDEDFGNGTYSPPKY